MPLGLCKVFCMSPNKQVSALLVLSKTDDLNRANLGVRSLCELQKSLSHVVVVLNGLELKTVGALVPSINQIDASKLIYVESKKFLRFGPALNLGMNATSSEWIMRVDPDDINLNYRLDLFIKATHYFDFDIFYTSIKNLSGKKVRFQKNILVEQSKHNANLFWLKNPIPHSTVFFKREKVVGIGGYQDIPLMEDYDLWIRLSAEGAVFFYVNVPTILFNDYNLRQRRLRISALKSELKITLQKKKFLRVNILKILVALIIRFGYYLIPFRS